MALPRIKLKRYAANRTITLDIEKVGHFWNVRAWAPAGKLFQATGTHCCSLQGNGNYAHEEPNWDEAKDKLTQIITCGFAECEDPDCDCRDE